MTLLFSGQGAGTPVQVLVGRGAPTFNLNKNIDLSGGGLRVEETGNSADDTCSFEVVDFLRVINEIHPEAHLLVKEGPKVKFRGFIRTFEPTAEAIHNRVTVNAVGISSILDKCIIPPAGGGAYVRRKAESDRARILWLLKTFGQPFLVHASNDFSKVQVLEPAMEKQDFSNLTLRQAIEQVLAVASESANYYVDQTGRLHTFDEDHEEGLVAPYDINQVHTLADSEAPAANFRVIWDTAELINYYYVRGKNKAGSGAFSNAASIDRYGRRQAFLDGPDSDTRRKARRLGKAALRDTKDPLPRISFTVSDQYATNEGLDWSPGQKVTMTSPSTGWLKNIDRILRVTTTYQSSSGIKRVDIEVGALRRLFGFGGYPGAPYGYNPTRPVPEITVYPPEIDDGDPVLTPPPKVEGEPASRPVLLGVESGNESSTFRPIDIAIPDGADAGSVAVNPGRAVVLWLSYDQEVAGVGIHALVLAEVAALGFTHLPQCSMSVTESDINNNVYGHQVFYRVLDGSEGYPATAATIQLPLTPDTTAGLPASAATGMALDAGTTITLAVPDGSSVIGRFLLACIGWDSDDNDLHTAMEGLGWTDVLTSPQFDGVYRFNWFYRVIDGTEGFTGTGDSITLTGLTSANVVAGFDLLDGWYDDGGPYFAVTPGATANPGAVADLGWPDGVPVRWYTALFTDNAGTIDAPPAGYTEIGQAAQGPLRIALAAKNNALDAEDPGAFDETGNDVLQSFTLALRGGEVTIPDLVSFRWATALVDEFGEIDGNIAYHAASVSFEADPPAFTPPWHGGMPALWFAHLTSGNAIFLMPTGYTTLTGFTMHAGNNNASVALRDGDNDSQSFDPPPFGPDSSEAAVGNVVIRGIAPSEGVTVEDEFTGDGTTATFALTTKSTQVTLVRVDGIVVDDVTVDLVAGTITFDRAPSDGAVIEVEYIAGTDVDFTDTNLVF